MRPYCLEGLPGRSQKHNSMSELGEQIDAINKNKAKSEKDKAGMERDLRRPEDPLRRSP